MCIRDSFTTFWRLSLYDIHFDKSLYDERKNALSGENTDHMSNRKKHLIQNQIKDILVTGISHQRAFKKNSEFISEKSNTWNKDCGEDQIKIFLQNCVVPRVLFSPSDALFSSYFIYNEMMTKLSQDILPIKVSFNKAEREAKSILKALSIDTIAKESRRFAKLISTNPLASLIPAVKQIENYDKVSELVVYTTKYFNDFAYDVLQFVLLLRLTYNRPAVQFDGVNQAMWVQRLSIFIAGLAKSCPSMDISNIITYILKTLHNGNIIAVSILKELIITVGGIRDLNEVNMKQLLMLNSGSPLKRYARHLIYDFRDDNSVISSRLTSFFSDQNAISEIILLLYTLNPVSYTHLDVYKRQTLEYPLQPRRIKAHPQTKNSNRQSICFDGLILSIDLVL